MHKWIHNIDKLVNPLNAELNPICHLPALFGAHQILHVCRIRVNEAVNAADSVQGPTEGEELRSPYVREVEFVEHLTDS